MRLYFKIICTIILVFTCLPHSEAHSRYYTYLNKFGSFHHDNTLIENNKLTEHNDTDSIRFNCIPVVTNKENFNCFLRIANMHNQEGKSVKIRDKQGKKRTISHPTWGLVWNYTDNHNYYAIRLQGYNTMLYDILDTRSLNIDIIQMRSGEEKILQSHNVTKNVDIQDGFNNIMIKYDGNTTRVYIGKKQLQQIATLDITYPDTIFAGYFAGSGASIEMERFVTKTNRSKNYQLQTRWTKSSIDSYFQSKKTDLMEGFWDYLDRNLNETTTKLGGKYTLAIVKNQFNGYDILYYDGAVVNAANWQCGMLKGRIKQTDFANNYDLIWYDAMMNEYCDDTNANVEAYKLLTFLLPIEKAQLRFVKK